MFIGWIALTAAAAPPSAPCAAPTAEAVLDRARAERREAAAIVHDDGWSFRLATEDRDVVLEEMAASRQRLEDARRSVRQARRALRGGERTLAGDATCPEAPAQPS